MDQSIPHVLLFPFPTQGHINPMLKLAELLCHYSFQVTFLNFKHTHDLLVRHTDIHSRFTRWPGFLFKTITDCLPADHPRSSDILKDLFASIQSITKPLFREMLKSGSLNSDVGDPVTCIIADGLMTFTIDIAQELNIPVIIFRTVSACSFWAYFCIPKLIELGEIPFNDDQENMDRPISCVPGMENILRRRDLPSFCRVKDPADPVLQAFQTENRKATRASAVILNTFEELEAPILSQIRSCCPKLYTVGPLHALLNSKLSDLSPSVSTINSLWEVDRNCITWLDSQPLKSVVYASFGSAAVITRDELLEFWYGLVNSKKRFLWVIRPGSISGKEGDRQIPKDLEEGISERWCIVEWAPQEEILYHPAVGGFLTHSGWNSTLESMVAGIPMICWPYFADQQVNSRFVSEVWKVGLDMKDTCDRLMVEKMVRDLMEDKREELMSSADKIAVLARKSVRESGSSYCNMDVLVQDIRIMTKGHERYITLRK